MTTEIAVLNSLGIAIAADSAVTISSNRSSKVFNSADKLFELSESYPIGVMINDNMGCFGIPREIMIKDFRNQFGSVARKSVKDWATAFLDFVENRPDILPVAGKEFTFFTLKEELNYIKNQFVFNLWEHGSTKKDIDIEAEIQKIANERHDNLNKTSKVKRIDINDVKKFITENVDEISEIISQETPIDANKLLIDTILSNLALALVSDVRSPYSTGIVFAGYGETDTYPSVHAVSVHGYVCSKLKYSDFKSKIVENGLSSGHVLSFAQTDVTERLLDGVDPKFVKRTADFIEDAVDKVAPIIVEAIAPKRAKRNARVQQKVREILREIDRVYQNDAARKLRKEFRDEFERMIAMMPKMELIEFAEAMVNITAVERKATTDQGTVGGPIDVAFITKHEGFVWIKRKHYFDPKLNPRYFWRRFSATPSRGDEIENPQQ